MDSRTSPLDGTSPEKSTQSLHRTVTYSRNLELYGRVGTDGKVPQFQGEINSKSVKSNRGKIVTSSLHAEPLGRERPQAPSRPVP